MQHRVSQKIPHGSKLLPAYRRQSIIKIEQFFPFFLRWFVLAKAHRDADLRDTVEIDTDEFYFFTYRVGELIGCSGRRQTKPQLCKHRDEVVIQIQGQFPVVPSAHDGKPQRAVSGLSTINCKQQQNCQGDRCKTGENGTVPGQNAVA